MATADVIQIVQHGDEAALHKKFTEAVSLYSDALEKGPSSSTEILMKRCHCLFDNEQYEKAYKDAEAFVEKKPKEAEGYIMCGKSLTKLKRFEQALEIYKKGLAFDPKNEAIISGLKGMQEDIISSFEGGEESSYDAVKHCSQDRYPGDDELEILEKDILEKWGLAEFPDIRMMIPDQTKAFKEFQCAFHYKTAGNKPLAMDKVKAAVETDATNFKLWGEGANVLLELDEPKLAFQYCNVIPIECRSAKYWKLGGKILDRLELPVMAETWIRQACKVDKNDEESRLLFQKIRVKRLYGPLTEGTKAEVGFNKFGRAVIARESAEPGEVLFRDRPAILSQTLDTLSVKACSNCAKCLMTAEDYFGKEALASDKVLRLVAQKHWPKTERIPCGKCSRVVYCSKNCKEEGWAMHHQILCPVVHTAVEALYDVCDNYANLSTTDTRVWSGVWNASYSPMMLARIWANIICIANQLAKQEGREKPSPADWATAKSPYRKFIAYGSSSNAEMIPKMLELMQNIFHNLPDGQRYEITKREFDGRYFQATCNVQAFSDHAPPYNVFMNAIANERCRPLLDKYVSKEPESAIFAGMFPLHACLNHACDNNVEVLDGENGVVVKSRLPIKAGEELFTTYINTRMPRRQRRAWLFRGYNFWCHCRRCQFEGDGPETCTQCGIKAENEQEKFPACSRCHKAWYCSTACQKVAWKKGHKRICKPM